MNMFIAYLQIFGLLASNLVAQQHYSKNSVLNCPSEQSRTDLYSCNGVQNTCRAFLTFRAQPGYDNVFTISKFTSSDAAELARVNSISDSIIFPLDQEVILPVNCSSSGAGQYYQADMVSILSTSYH